MEKKIMSLVEWQANANPSDLNIDETVLDELVEMVGSEEEVETAAKEAFEELSAAYEKGDMELTGEDTPEKLAIAALVVKLVEMGKLGPEDADSFIDKNFNATGGEEQLDQER